MDEVEIFKFGIEDLKGEKRIDYCLGKIVIYENRMKFKFSSHFKLLGDKLNNFNLIKTDEEKKYYESYHNFNKKYIELLNLCYNEIKNYSFNIWRRNCIDLKQFNWVFYALYKYLPEFRERSDVKKLYKIIKNRYDELIKEETGKYPLSRFENNPSYINPFMSKLIKEEDLIK